MIRRVLLTGATGMLGSALHRAARTLKPDWEILAPSHQELDLTNQHATADYLARSAVDLVIHAAGKVGGITANMNDQSGFLTHNMLMGFNLIEAARNAGVKNFINFGSSCMYPRNLSGTLSEDDLLTAPLEPTNEGYALAKIAATKLCAYIADQYGFAYRTLIPCNLYGPHDNYDPSRSHVLAAALLKIHTAKMQRKDSTEIWGDGTARREFVFVDDLARFVVTHAESFAEFPPLLNTGAGADISINDLYNLLARVVGFTGEFTHDRAAPVGMTRKLMNSEKAKTLGWQPETTLEEGLRRTYASFLEEQKH